VASTVAEMQMLCYSAHVLPLSFTADPFVRSWAFSFDGNATFSCPRTLKEWIKAEFMVFVGCLSYILTDLFSSNDGNPFAQLQYDGVTVKKTQMQSVGVSFLTTEWLKFNVCVAFFKHHGHDTKEIANMVKDIFRRRYKLNVEDIVSSARADAAAVKTSEYLELDKEVCEMHNADKVCSK
jgi:hypothetical protein